MSTHCRKCNRILKNPDAIRKGIGPVCERRELLFRGITPNDGDNDIFVPYDGGDFFIERVACPTITGPFGQTEIVTHTASGIRTNVPRSIYKHSPTGYNFGYGGSGPADFALNVALAAGVHADVAYRHYQSFKFAVVALEQSDRLVISRETVIVYFDAVEKQRIAAESTPAE